MSRETRSIRPTRMLRPSLATLAARGVRSSDPGPERGRPSTEPLVQTSVFAFDTIEAAEPALRGEGGHVYARYGMPNGQTLERTVAALEGAEAALATSSGMAALVCAVLACVKPGARVVCQADAYGGTRSVLDEELSRLGASVVYVDAYDPAAVGDALSEGASLMLAETLSNPLVREVDVAAIAWHCRAYGVPLLIDNTFATPIFKRPLADGADLVMHSATKFLGGHHDLCAGVLAGDAKVVAAARGVAQRLGCVVAPFDAWLAARGIKTLEVRMMRAEENARFLAERLGQHPAVERLHYPGFGAMLAFDVGSRARAEQVVRRASSIPLVPSLGGTETAFSHSASSSHRGLTPAQRAELGIGEGLLRVSVGIEDPEDLWQDLGQALELQKETRDGDM